MFFRRRLGRSLAFRAGDARDLDHRRLGLLIGEHRVEVIVRFKILDQSKHFLLDFFKLGILHHSARYIAGDQPQRLQCDVIVVRGKGAPFQQRLRLLQYFVRVAG